MTDILIDDRSIATPPYKGPKKNQLEDRIIKDDELEAMLKALLSEKRGKKAAELSLPVLQGELEESIALALQNYRSGLIDVDDLVAFLVPVRLEEQGDAT